LKRTIIDSQYSNLLQIVTESIIHPKIPDRHPEGVPTKGTPSQWQKEREEGSFYVKLSR